MWTTDDLGTVPSVFLYVKYVQDIKMHRLGHFQHIASASLEMPQATVDLYLTKDGLPIHNAAVEYFDYTKANGYTKASKPYDYANCDPYLTFRNRDTRLAQMVIPPYHVNLVGVNEGAADNSNCWVPDDSADGKYSEYLDQFAYRGTQGKLKDGRTYWCSPNFNLGYHQIETHKSLPSTNWAGNVLVNEPHTQAVNSQDWSGGKTQYGSGKGFQKGHSGYFVWKHVANWDRQYASGTADVSDNRCSNWRRSCSTMRRPRLNWEDSIKVSPTPPSTSFVKEPRSEGWSSPPSERISIRTGTRAWILCFGKSAARG